MIPLSSITEWSNTTPWVNRHLVEHDLVLCRALTEIFSNKLLSEKLAFRGGTALHKLYLSPQPRYSEDIDLVQIVSEPIGEVIQNMREALSFLGNPVIKQKRNNNTIIYRYLSETLPQSALRLKIEINCREHINILGMTEIRFEMRNSWFSGNCNLKTYTVEELAGSKLRALFQRRKGRDLFDIYYAHKQISLDVQKTIQCYNEYMLHSVGRIPSAKEYLDNISDKVNDSGFRSDMDLLLRPGVQYDINEAYDVVRKYFVSAM